MSDKRKAAMLELYEAYLNAFDAYHYNRDNLSTALKSFCSAYVDVACAINPKLTAKRAEYLFKLDADLYNRDVLNAHIYTAREYAMNVVSRIDANDELNLLSEAPAIIFDYAHLMKIVERVYDIPFGEFAGERNMKVDAYTSYKLANQIYWGQNELQRSNALNGYAIFGLRHSIELAGKELLDVQAIVDADGTTYKYSTQLPWKFFDEKQNSLSLEFPFCISDIYKTFKWANSFVHSGKNATCYVIGFALNETKRIFQVDPSISGHCNYRNRINRYSTVKRLFQEFVAENTHDTTKSIVWVTPNLANISE